MPGGLPTFDIEAINWTHPIAVGFFDGEEYHEFIKDNERDDVIWRFLWYLNEYYKGFKLYAHCSSRYDSKFLLLSLCQHDEVVEMEAGLMRLKWKTPNILFEDSYLLVPMSLNKLGKMFGKGIKEEWEHQLTVNPWDMGDKLQIFREYLKKDCLLLSDALFGVCEALGTNFGITPSISLSTTSAKAFSTCFYPLRKVESNEDYEEFVRAAVYGGRNEVYRRYGEGINQYDVKSMFVSCYDTPVPIGKMRWVRPNINSGTLAEASVKIPKDTYIGPLPYRLYGKLIFPIGELTSWWDTRELRYAAQLGVDVSIRRQLLCEEEPILKDFGEFVNKLRSNSHGEFWKVFGLALSGKLGQGRWRDIVTHRSNIKDFKGLVPLDPSEEYFLGKEYVKGNAPYIKPAISMRIRSEARIRHLKIINEAYRSGEVFYCDTDSIFTTAKMPIGDRPGELVYLGKFDKGYFIRQKLYALLKGGKLEQRSSGFSDLKLTEEDFIELLGGKELEVETPYLPSYKKVLQDQEFSLLGRTRKILGELDRESRVQVGQDTEPICLPLHT